MLAWLSPASIRKFQMPGRQVSVQPKQQSYALRKYIVFWWDFSQNSWSLGQRVPVRLGAGWLLHDPRPYQQVDLET